MPDEQIPGQLPLFDLPEGAADPLAELRHEYGVLARENKRKMDALRRQQVMPDPFALVATRLEALTDLLIGDDEQRRLRLGLAYEVRLSPLLDRCLAERRQHDLLSGLDAFGRPTGPAAGPPGPAGRGSKLIVP